MDIRVGTLKKRTFFWTFLVSLILHLLMLIFFVHWKENGFLLFPAMKETLPEKQIAFEIVETPEASPTPPKDATLRSDKNSIARDSNPLTTDSDLPFSKGISDAKVIPSPATASKPEEAQTASQSEESSQSQTTDDEAIPSQTTLSERQPGRSSFSRERLVAYQESSPSGSQAIYDQQAGSVRDFGGFSLNTYAWDFAPYLLDLKRRIEKNIFPPPVFTRMGSGGQNVFRFRIMPDGSLVSTDLLSSQGEKALIATSENAIKYSVPFKPLPKDFPKEYLEITARFDYYIVTDQQ